MDNQKTKAIITGVLVIILAIALFANFKPKKKTSSPVSVDFPASDNTINLPPPEARVKQDPTLQIEASSKEIEEQKKRAESEWGVDPFYHIVKKEAYGGSPWELKGISIRKGKKGYAYINDEVVGEGEIIDGAELLEVQKNKVLLKKGESTFYRVLTEE